MRHATTAVILTLFTAGCWPQPAAQPKNAIQIPAALCAKVNEDLDALSSKAVLTIDGQGSATIEHAVWLRMDDDARNRLANSLAYRASCAADEKPVELTVTIRSGRGLVLTQRLVDLSVPSHRLLD